MNGYERFQQFSNFKVSNWKPTFAVFALICPFLRYSNGFADRAELKNRWFLSTDKWKIWLLFMKLLRMLKRKHIKAWNEFRIVRIDWFCFGHILLKMLDALFSSKLATVQWSPYVRTSILNSYVVTYLQSIFISQVLSHMYM